jgi:PadR family transcriptional regulator, regulatory protein PadR
MAASSRLWIEPSIAQRGHESISQQEATNMQPHPRREIVPHDIYSNLVHFYVLHHACHWPTFGLHIIEELGGLGYKVSPGTMYPLLDALEQKGMLQSREVRLHGTVRRLYRATAKGRTVFAAAKAHIEKLLQAIRSADAKNGRKARRTK